MQQHWHWEFIAFNESDQITPAGTISFGVTVEVAGYLSEADARVAGKDVVKRDKFHLRRVWECRTCNINSENSAALQKLAQAAG